MALTLPYPTYTPFISTTVHSASAHNIPHAGLLSNDEYLRSQLETTQADVSTLQSTVGGISYKKIDLVPFLGQTNNVNWWYYFQHNYDFRPILNLQEYIADGYDFNSYGVLNWFFHAYGGQSNEKLTFQITTSAGVWTVFQESTYRIPHITQEWYMFHVRYSLKNYSGLSSALGNYSGANLTPSSLYCPSNAPLGENTYRWQSLPYPSTPAVTYTGVEASSFSYILMRRHAMYQVGSGDNNAYWCQVSCYWDPFATAVSYPYIAYWKDAVPGTKIVAPQ